MEIDELLLIADRNRQYLQKLEDDFYDRVREKIAELERRREDADEDEIERIDDEIRTLKRLQKRIFEIRTGKIVNAAWADVCGQPVSEEMENMTSEERRFFRELASLIKKFRDSVLFGKRDLESKEEEYVLVRVKKDAEIVGSDGKKYKLRREDAVTLPKLNAETLIKSGFAEKIETGD